MRRTYLFLWGLFCIAYEFIIFIIIIIIIIIFIFGLCCIVFCSVFFLTNVLFLSITTTTFNCSQYVQSRYGTVVVVILLLQQLPSMNRSTQERNHTGRIGGGHETDPDRARVRMCSCHHHYHHHHVCIVMYCILICLLSYHRSPPLYYHHHHNVCRSRYKRIRLVCFGFD